MLCALHTHYPWSLDLLIHIPFQFSFFRNIQHFQPFPRKEPIAHIAISVTPNTHLHLSQVMRVRVKCLVKGHNIEIMSQYWEARSYNINKWFDNKENSTGRIWKFRWQNSWEDREVEFFSQVFLLWWIKNIIHRFAKEDHEMYRQDIMRFMLCTRKQHTM